MKNNISFQNELKQKISQFFVRITQLKIESFLLRIKQFVCFCKKTMKLNF